VLANSPLALVVELLSRRCHACLLTLAFGGSAES
jgi:hypothetical protein